MAEKLNFDLNFGRFKTLTNKTKLEIYSKKKAKNTDDATKVWMKCFSEYLQVKALPKVEEIVTNNLPNILYNFFSEVKRKTLMKLMPKTRVITRTQH